MITNDKPAILSPTRVFMMLSLVLVSLLAGCAGNGPIPGSQNVQPQAYRLGSGDKLHVTVFNEDNLSGDYVITQAGNIAFPLAGNIHAAGLTVPELQQAVAATLAKGYVQDPHVIIDTTGLRPFFILGEVNKPGQYSYLPDLTVMNAVATAQGFTYRADLSTVYIRHSGQPSEQEYPLTAAMIVEPGDTIRVTQRYF